MSKVKFCCNTHTACKPKLLLMSDEECSGSEESCKPSSRYKLFIFYLLDELSWKCSGYSTHSAGRNLLHCRMGFKVVLGELVHVATVLLNLITNMARNMRSFMFASQSLPHFRNLFRQLGDLYKAV